MIMWRALMDASANLDNLGFFNVHLNIGTRASSISPPSKIQPPRTGPHLPNSGKRLSTITTVSPWLLKQKNAAFVLNHFRVDYGYFFP